VATTKRASYKITLKKVGIFQRGTGITPSKWIDCLKFPDTAELIEAN
jgi:hypothetical protein